jgi:putative phosphoesterase
MTDPLAIPLFEAIAPFDAVAGNNDPDDIRKRFGRRKIVTVDGVRIGLVHGDAGRERTTSANAIAAFSNEDVDVILYGHSHHPRVEQHAGRLVANPGSPTDKRLMPLYSYGLLTIDGGVPRVELKFFNSRA